MRLAAAVLLISTAATAGCSRPTGTFSDRNARAHIEMLAGTIGSRPVGTAANARARAYVIDQLKLFGYDVRVQETDARRPELGLTARVSNIIATLPGERGEAVGILSHYDSTPETPGASDAGVGTGVAIEAARVLAAREGRRWTLLILLTDGEEAGLMGAAGLMTDREVTERLRAYINVEAVGSSGPSILFETGPANHWIVRPWARAAPHPRGGSFGLEIYRRLPNDTDFTILKRREIPGLNFASIGDSYAYHTARDVPDRIPSDVVLDTGENVVAIVGALDRMDITQRSASEPTFFDIGGTVALSYGGIAGWLLTGAALVLGVIASVRMTTAALRMGGIGRWLLTAVWSAAAIALVFASMVGVTWALRAAREVYHPWYARPGRLWLLMLATGVTVAWAMSRIGEWIPPRIHGPRHPTVTWSLALPLWIVLASAALWLAPAAAFLWTLPLLAAGATLTVFPATSSAAVRVASVLILAVAATLWLANALDLLQFMVAVLGRLPIITPVFTYAALMMLAGLMVVPPFIGIVASPHPLPAPSLVTALLLMACAVAGGLAYSAPAYTYEQPLRRHVRAIQEPGATSALWEVASMEPGLDLAGTAPPGWRLESSRPEMSVPVGAFRHPFVFRTDGPGLGPAPVEIRGWTIQPMPGGVELDVTVVPSEPGIKVAFILPAGIAPARSSLPGVVRLGRWVATYTAPPPDGLVWRATFTGDLSEQLRATHVAVTSAGFPGGEGWQRLPAWLPQDRTVWSGAASWIVPAPPAAAVEQVPLLR
jgi:hypothetical protein